MSETPPSSKPSYGSAIRVAQIIHWLHELPYGISLQELRSRLGVSERTLARYIQTLKESFFDEEGEALVEVAKGGPHGRLRFRRRGLDMEGTAYELMSLYMALGLMAFLEGTFIQEGAQEALDRLQNTLQRRHGHETALVLKDFQKKFFQWSEAPKDYSGHNELLDQLIKALVLQRGAEIVYQRPGGPEKVHRIQPLSLIMFKRALYLVGRKHKEDRVLDLTLAIERIKQVTVSDQGFAYPQDYDPAGRFQEHFGLVRENAEPADLVLHFDSEVAANVASRKWHKTQDIERHEDGSVTLRMQVGIGEELIAWILGYGHHVRIVAPQSLRQTIGERLRRALDLYTD